MGLLSPSQQDKGGGGDFTHTTHARKSKTIGLDAWGGQENVGFFTVRRLDSTVRREGDEGCSSYSYARTLLKPRAAKWSGKSHGALTVARHTVNKRRGLPTAGGATTQ